LRWELHLYSHYWMRYLLQLPTIWPFWKDKRCIGRKRKLSKCFFKRNAFCHNNPLRTWIESALIPLLVWGSYIHVHVASDDLLLAQRVTRWRCEAGVDRPCRLAFLHFLNGWKWCVYARFSPQFS
jgi:hypothetical protein